MAAEIERFKSQSNNFIPNSGDCEPVGEGIRELKINYAKGYRVYFNEKDGKIIILLVGGDKSTQQKDIEKAKEILKKNKK